MSLFKLKPIWAKSYSEEEFDQKHLAIGKINKKCAIVLGSFQGKLRVLVLGRQPEV